MGVHNKGKEWDNEDAQGRESLTDCGAGEAVEPQQVSETGPGGVDFRGGLTEPWPGAPLMFS